MIGVVTVKGLTSKKGNKFDPNMRYEKNQDTNISVGRWSLIKNSYFQHNLFPFLSIPLNL